MKKKTLQHRPDSSKILIEKSVYKNWLDGQSIIIYNDVFASLMYSNQACIFIINSPQWHMMYKYWKLSTVKSSLLNPGF
jgi:hypothetical protein